MAVTVDAALMVPIAGHPGARLRSGAAASWAHCRSEVQRRYGWTPRITSDADAYRSLAIQTRIFLERYIPARTGGGFHGDIRWWNGVRYVREKGYAAAAVPGTSNHGKGVAVDITGLTASRYAEWAAVAIPAGWSNAEGMSVGEKWHWVFTGPVEAVSNPVTSAPTAPTAPVIDPIDPLTPRRLTVRVLHDVSTNNFYRVGETTFVQLGTGEVVADEVAVWGPAVVVSTARVQSLLRQVQAAQAQIKL